MNRTNHETLSWVFMLMVWAAFFYVLIFDAAAGSTRLTLRGKLYATEQEAENGQFFIDPEDDSESIGVVANAGGYVSDYLQGTVGHDIVITIEPK